MHQQGSLIISVHHQDQVLPGEGEEKIWMWHRCLICPRVNNVPPATHRVLISDAAWGLSFGKFLELSFSSHAAAGRVAACGHSLHRDCLRFYGYEFLSGYVLVKVFCFLQCLDGTLLMQYDIVF
jgi:1-phosphatidylinositol-3-phosphate 5-kinase